MPTNQPAVEHLQVVVRGGKTTVSIAWNDAESLQTHLRKRQIDSTVCLDPVTRQALLEVWPEIAADKVQAALDCWQGSRL